MVEEQVFQLCVKFCLPSVFLLCLCFLNGDPGVNQDELRVLKKLKGRKKTVANDCHSLCFLLNICGPTLSVAMEHLYFMNWI
ncbi:hypothetical protein GDO81_019772 [Engystomops pustulosus]|uniref:Secreted protein n=1 Tax=Engystomops pustulosus TaxID=76066 RepID=A0AAV6YTY9_ENGPU|nr:hypothetical protein GDO81_019772 [Engystomops pustulosus]